MTNDKESLVTLLVNQDVFTVIDVLTILGAIASLILAIVAIFLSVAFKRDADKVNRDTSDLLIEIRSDAKSISEGVMEELRAYGRSMRGAVIQNTIDSPGEVTGEVTDFKITPSGSSESGTQ